MVSGDLHRERKEDPMTPQPQQPQKQLTPEEIAILSVLEMCQRPERDAYDQYHEWHDKLRMMAGEAKKLLLARAAEATDGPQQGKRWIDVRSGADLQWLEDCGWHGWLVDTKTGKVFTSQSELREWLESLEEWPEPRNIPKRQPAKPKPVHMAGRPWKTACGKDSDGNTVSTDPRGVTCAECANVLEGEQPKPAKPEDPAKGGYDPESWAKIEKGALAAVRVRFPQANADEFTGHMGYCLKESEAVLLSAGAIKPRPAPSPEPAKVETPEEVAERVVVECDNKDYVQIGTPGGEDGVFFVHGELSLVRTVIARIIREDREAQGKTFAAGRDAGLWKAAGVARERGQIILADTLYAMAAKGGE